MKSPDEKPGLSIWSAHYAVRARNGRVRFYREFDDRSVSEFTDFEKASGPATAQSRSHCVVECDAIGA